MSPVRIHLWISCFSWNGQRRGSGRKNVDFFELCFNRSTAVSKRCLLRFTWCPAGAVWTRWRPAEERRGVWWIKAKRGENASLSVFRAAGNSWAAYFFPSSEAGVVWSEVLCRRVKLLVHGRGECVDRVCTGSMQTTRFGGSVRDQKCLFFFLTLYFILPYTLWKFKGGDQSPI